MPQSSSSVEVQAPPGLEHAGDCGAHPPWILGPGGSGGPEEAAGDKGGLQGLKAQLVREVADTVHEQIEGKVTGAVDALWQRGQRAVQQLHQQQKAQTEQLQSQLAACAESYRQLEHDNAMLRSSLEALMKHLTIVFGTPPYMQAQPQHLQHPQAPFSPGHAAAPPLSGPPGAAARQAAALAPVARSPGAPGALPRPGGGEGAGAGEDSQAAPISSDGSVPSTPTDALTAPTAAASLAPQAQSSPAAAGAAAPAALTPSGGTGSDPAGADSPVDPAAAPPAPISGGSPVPALTFSVKLRRADRVPLGLDLQHDADASHLIVQAVRPDGAVEAWNRQCAGDIREIRPGDRIIQINDKEDPHSMGQECLSKFFLKVTVLRGSSEQLQSAPSAARGLRADADEFVPQVGALPQ